MENSQVKSFSDIKENQTQKLHDIYTEKESIYTRMISKDAEFQTLKDEIMTLTQCICNYNIALYTLCVTVLGFALEKNNSALTLLIYLIIYFFQSHINAAQEGCSRISAYIQAFLEEDSESYWYWEKYRFEVNSFVWKATNYQNHKKWYTAIMWNSSMLFSLSAIGVSFWVYYTSPSSYSKQNFFIFLLTCALTFITYKIDSDLFKLDDNFCVKARKLMIAFKKQHLPKDFSDD